LAKYIHDVSSRHNGPFIAVNIAAIPKDLLESELFGVGRRVATNVDMRPGKFELANGGSLFLDEIGELPMLTQAKLLRVLQDGMVEPIGAREPHRVDVRIVAATNRNLREAVRDGKFREDLFYRLNVVVINLPPLRERRSDIPKIALHILDKLNAASRRQKRLSQAALKILQKHDWPGNVRELENVIANSALLTRAGVIDADDINLMEPVSFGDRLAMMPEPHEGFALEEFLKDARKQMMERALAISGGNQSEAARLLGITPQAVNKFLRSA